MNAPLTESRPHLKWYVCGMLLLALVLNYMDRQTLSFTITAIEQQIHTNNAQYGRLERGFGIAFAVGGIAWGIAADRFSVRWLYPCVLLGWSAAGVATGFGDRIGDWLVPLCESWIDLPALTMTEDPEVLRPYFGFFVCRVVLGFFEAGQWPCALVTTQRLLSAADRPFGNSILQSGASIGAILTPIVIGFFDPRSPGVELPEELLGWWRSPYVVVGCLGVLWIAPWLWIVKGVDLRRPPADSLRSANVDAAANARGETFWDRYGVAIRRYVALVFVVIAINLMWQFFRAWLPKILEQSRGYSADQVRWILVGYFIAADIGCIWAGWLVRWLAARGWSVHRARVLSYSICAALTALTTLAASLGQGWLLIGSLLIIGFGALGLFPNYYSFNQEISGRHQGVISGSLGCITWYVSSEMMEVFGKHVDETKSYDAGVFWIGLVPLVGVVALLALWGRDRVKPSLETSAAEASGRG